MVGCSAGEDLASRLGPELHDASNSGTTKIPKILRNHLIVSPSLGWLIAWRIFPEMNLSLNDFEILYIVVV